MNQNHTNKGTSIKKTEITIKSYLINLLLLVLVIFSSGIIISALILYLDIYKSLSTHYSAAISILAGLEKTLFMKTIQINAIFYLFIAAGILAIGVFYSHRIAGPLYRIKLYAKTISEGKLHGEIKFRKKDAIHSFAEELNRMTKNYEQRLTLLDSRIQDLENVLKKINTLQEHDKATEAEVRKALEIDQEIKSILGNIKL